MTPRRHRPKRDELLRENGELRRRLVELSGGPPRPTAGEMLDLIDAFADGYLILDESLTIVELNRGTERLFGLSSEDAIGRPIGELIPGDAIATHTSQLRVALASGAPHRPRRISLNGRRGSGDRFRVEVTLARRRFTGSEGWLLTFRNLAVLQAALDTLDVVEQRYEALAEVVPVAVFRTDVQGRCIYVSRRWTELTGFGLLDALGDGWRMIVHPHDQERISRESEAPLIHGLPTRNEHRIRRTDGSTLWVLVHTAPERDSAGRILGYVGTMTDITAHKHLEAALRLSEEQFRLMFRENPIPMWVYDRETLFFLEVNDAAIRRYGWTREEFLHRKITDIRPPSDIPRLLRSLAERPPGWYRTNRWRHRLKDGSLVSVEVAAHPTRFDGREAVLVAVYLPDAEADSPPVVEAGTGERDGNGSAAGD